MRKTHLHLPPALLLFEVSRKRTERYYIKELRRKIATKVKHAKVTRSKYFCGDYTPFAHTISAIFSTFNYADAVDSNESRRQRNARKVEAEKTVWLDGKARVGYSNDGVPIVYHLPYAISQPVHVSLFV